MWLNRVSKTIKICFVFLACYPIELMMVNSVNSCNEAVCGSIVTKCLLMKSCMCLQDNYQCHKSCFECLGDYNTECCPCLEFCPKPKQPQFIDRQSYIEDFEETIPGLFRALTEYPDQLNRWRTETFPVQFRTDHHDSSEQIKWYAATNANSMYSYYTYLNINYCHSSKESDKYAQLDEPLNCTVVFLRDCLSVNKCRRSCLQMGASSFRWFHDGCCECVGENCIYYGSDKSSCDNCPENEDAISAENEIDDDYDYGEEDYEESYNN